MCFSPLDSPPYNTLLILLLPLIDSYFQNHIHLLTSFAHTTLNDSCFLFLFLFLCRSPSVILLLHNICEKGCFTSIYTQTSQNLRIFKTASHIRKISFTFQSLPKSTIILWNIDIYDSILCNIFTYTFAYETAACM